MKDGQKIEPRGLRAAAPYAVLFAIAAALYAKTVTFGFIPSWDDGKYVLDNTIIFSFSGANLKTMFTEAYFGNYAPLHLLSYAVDHAIWGIDPRGYHLANTLLHAVNAALVYAALRSVTRNTIASFVAALLFAAHPLNVENVAWVTERKTLLVAFFSFLSIIAYARFAEKGGAGPYVLSLLFFVFAILSKPLAVALPPVILAYEMFMRRDYKAWKRVMPFIALAAAAALVAIIAHAGEEAVDKSLMTPEKLFGVVYPTMAPVFWKYVHLIVWPVNLSGFYDTTMHFSLLEAAPLASIAAWLAAGALVFWKGGAAGRFFFSWFWLWLLPVANIIPIAVYYADRYMYLPAIALFAVVGYIVSALWERRVAWQKAAGAAIAFALFAFFSVAAFYRMDVWADEFTFWKDTAAKAPELYPPRLNLGYAYEMRGMFREAEAEYQAAVRIWPSREAVENLNMVRMKIRIKEGGR